MTHKEIVFAKVPQVVVKEDKVLVPLTPVGNTHFAATIAYDLAELGFPKKVIELYNPLTRRNSIKAIRAYIRERGRLGQFEGMRVEEVV